MNEHRREWLTAYVLGPLLILFSGLDAWLLKRVGRIDGLLDVIVCIGSVLGLMASTGFGIYCVVAGRRRLANDH